MKIHTSILILLTAVYSVSAGEKLEAVKNTIPDIQFNQELAELLGADDYGMKMYVMAFLKAGPNRDRSIEEAAELQKAHMANIKRMAESGNLVLAGPFASNDSGIQGIFIFNVATVDEAKALTTTDPAIQAGSLVMELIPWYGSAALMQVNEIGQTLAKKSF